jgi:hypothetical protein
MQKRSTNSPSKLWAITSYYNPMGYRTRRVNYDAFWRNLSISLLTVEQGFHGDFELGDQDATKLIQVSAPDVMWQKERLLNLALEQLPDECEAVSWIDCDLIFERSDWPELVMETLEENKLVQLFGEVRALKRDADLSMPLSNQYYLNRRSVASGLVDGLLDRHQLAPTRDILKTHGMASDFANGYAWAMKREPLERIGFYDASIIGGGDYKLFQAARGRWDVVRESHSLNDREFEYYHKWAVPFYEEIQGQIGCVPGNTYHLWHGELRDRQYLPRHSVLKAHDFDPTKDIALDESGCWRWNSDKPALHETLRRFFVGRREDGAYNHSDGSRALI